MDSTRDGWHSWPLSHNWPGLEGEVDAAFSWEDKLYLIQVQEGWEGAEVSSSSLAVGEGLK